MRRFFASFLMPPSRTGHPQRQGGRRDRSGDRRGGDHVGPPPARSTIFNGLQVDFDTFKNEMGGDMAAQ